MSTVMYAYSCHKKNLWPVVRWLRSLCNEHPIYQNNDKEHIKHLLEIRYGDERRRAEIIDEEFKVELQVFDINDHYYFRILSSGWWLENQISKLKPILFKPAFYDDRADQPEEQLKNKGLANKIDELIRKRRFFIIPIKNLQDLLFPMP